MVADYPLWYVQTFLFVLVNTATLATNNNKSNCYIAITLQITIVNNYYNIFLFNQTKNMNITLKQQLYVYVYVDKLWHIEL